MDKNVAQTAIKNLYGEAFSLEPTSIIQLFEIDVSDIGFNRGVISVNEINSDKNVIFRFHNNIKLTQSSIFWRGKEYIAAPVYAEGYEVNAKGTLPTPKLAMTVSEEGIPYLSVFKNRLLQLGDLVGAKVTRIRTFAKFLDAENFYGTVPPQGFNPNPGSEFGRDVFYIDRKSSENKTTIEFELASLLDVEGVKLPTRRVVANCCNFQYRGAGCCYESNFRRNIEEHGTETESTLPTFAPPVANDLNEKISVLLSGVALVDKGEYDPNLTYNSGEFVFIARNNVNYYFVANGVDVNVPPPNLRRWIPDMCSKNVRGCELRFAIGGSAQGVTLGNLPFGGFLAVDRFK